MPNSRRRFLTAAASTIGAAALSPFARVTGAGTLPPAQAADGIDAAFDRSLVVDMLSVDDEWTDEVFAAFKRSGVTAIHTSLANRNLAVALRDLERWRAQFERHGNRLIEIRGERDVLAAKRDGKIGVLLGFQNATIVESDEENVDELYARGARCIQLTYNSRNLLGDGCTERTNAGLSDFGVAVVERMGGLGIIVDLSHCGEATSQDGIRFSRRPPAFTHTMCKAIYDHPRAKSDALLKAMADKGGVTGIATLGYFIGPTPATTLDDYLRHVAHAVKVAGVDHVGLASDYSIRGIEATATRDNWYVPRLSAFKPSYRVRWPPWIKELDPPERFRTIARGLAKRGFRTGDIEKILGGNWTRFVREAL